MSQVRPAFKWALIVLVAVIVIGIGGSYIYYSATYPGEYIWKMLQPDEPEQAGAEGFYTGTIRGLQSTIRVNYGGSCEIAMEYSNTTYGDWVQSGDKIKFYDGGALVFSGRVSKKGIMLDGNVFYERQ